MLRIFIGYDARESMAYHVLSHSILSRASATVQITPLVRNHLRWVHDRKREQSESTDFSLTRFLVPYLSSYEGYSVYMDCDMICLDDIIEAVFESIRLGTKAVSVCQHNYIPKTKKKFLGHAQTIYPRKNWSSFMVFNNARCRVLSPEYVNTAAGADLHRFQWIPDDLIGSLPLEWNWLVGEYASSDCAKILHYTLGGPWFPGYEDCEYADTWRAERDAMLNHGSVKG